VTATDSNTPNGHAHNCNMLQLLQLSAALYDILQHTATPQSNERTNGTKCNTLQQIIKQCHTRPHTTTYCNTLQHTATRCNTLQHAAMHCNTLQHTASHYTATHCNAASKHEQSLRIVTSSPNYALHSPARCLLPSHHTREGLLFLCHSYTHKSSQLILRPPHTHQHTTIYTYAHTFSLSYTHTHPHPHPQTRSLTHTDVTKSGDKLKSLGLHHMHLWYLQPDSPCNRRGGRWEGRGGRRRTMSDVCERQVPGR